VTKDEEIVHAVGLPESTTTNPAPPITGMASCLTPAERESRSSQVMGHSTAGSRQQYIYSGSNGGNLASAGPSAAAGH
jgi:hypothetical protein